ncbi:hypothetical protein K7432_018451, partial [Basidiobolus ranarum]
MNSGDQDSNQDEKSKYFNGEGIDELTIVEKGERGTGGQWGGHSMVNVETAEQEFKDLG